MLTESEKSARKISQESHNSLVLYKEQINKSLGIKLKGELGY